MTNNMRYHNSVNNINNILPRYVLDILSNTRTEIDVLVTEIEATIYNNHGEVLASQITRDDILEAINKVSNSYPADIPMIQNDETDRIDKEIEDIMSSNIDFNNIWDFISEITRVTEDIQSFIESGYEETDIKTNNEPPELSNKEKAITICRAISYREDNPLEIDKLFTDTIRHVLKNALQSAIGFGEMMNENNDQNNLCEEIITLSNKIETFSTFNITPTPKYKRIELSKNNRDIFKSLEDDINYNDIINLKEHQKEFYRYTDYLKNIKIQFKSVGISLIKDLSAEITQYIKENNLNNEENILAHTQETVEKLEIIICHDMDTDDDAKLKDTLNNFVQYTKNYIYIYEDREEAISVVIDALGRLLSAINNYKMIFSNASKNGFKLKLINSDFFISQEVPS